MNNTIRAFIAIDLDPKIRQAIGQAQDCLKKLDCNIKWVKPENAHLTLKFLGDVKLKMIETVSEILTNIFRNTPSIPTELTELGAFPDMDHPRILWVGFKDDRHQLAQLTAVIETKLGKIGLKKDRKTYHPHITIGRTRAPKNLKLLTGAMSNYKLPGGSAQTIKSAVLYKSALTPQGPIYETLKNFHFSGV